MSLNKKFCSFSGFCYVSFLKDRQFTGSLDFIFVFEFDVLFEPFLAFFRRYFCKSFFF